VTSFAGRRVLVVGLGASGFSAAKTLVELDAKVRVTELNETPATLERAEVLRREGIEVEMGEHDLDRLDADLAILSPGIPPSAPIVRAIRGEHIDVWSEVELAYRLARCDFLAVTGTNGKTTTTAILGAILAEAGITSAAAGNIGWPLIEAIAAVPEGGAIAVEVSSFQLAATDAFRPRIAVVLNIAEDHIDWHGSVDEYVAAKARIVANQTAEDAFLPNAADARAMEIASKTAARVVPFSSSTQPDSGIGVRAGFIVREGVRLLAVDDVPIPGEAGLEDAVAAIGAALEYGLDNRAIARAVKSFRPLAHRLEVVARAGGISYIDDSKATNPHATLTAVRGLHDVVLIAGGRSKGVDLSALAGTVPPVVAVVALGEAREAVAQVFEGLVPVEVVDTMAQAVRAAQSMAKPGGSVLLSPGCASLDMYESYSARGEDFARCVRAGLEGLPAEGG
jgi:UDP-N-acetylmuramoylalanine--D-glutamate ligase